MGPWEQEVPQEPGAGRPHLGEGCPRGTGGVGRGEGGGKAPACLLSGSRGPVLCHGAWGPLKAADKEGLSSGVCVCVHACVHVFTHKHAHVCVCVHSSHLPFFYLPDHQKEFP